MRRFGRLAGISAIPAALVLVGVGSGAGGEVAPAAAQTPTATCTDGRGRWLQVRNLSRQSLFYFRSRPSYSGGNWSDDYLGQTIVLSGSTVAIFMPSEGCACSADVQVTFEGPSGPTYSYAAVSYCTWPGETWPMLIVGN